MQSGQNLFDHYLIAVRQYLQQQCWDCVPVMAGRTFNVSPLAQGEYNLNYLLTANEIQLVFRLNIGTQINRADQIEYEYKTLRLLQKSGVTPRPYFVDDSRKLIDRGISIMEYLLGDPLDYRHDLVGAAQTFSTIHQIEVDDSENHLIVEKKPLSLIYHECSNLLQSYFNSELAKPEIADFLREIMIWGEKAKKKEQYFIDAPWPCIVNSEVNSGNFIVNRQKNSIHLIDWEMARWGDPTTDLCHFYSPLTTLWKTEYRFTDDSCKDFIQAYKKHIKSQILRDTLEDRLQLKLPFVCLRGISWSAMGWAAYQTDYQGIRNEDTWQKLNQYMDLDFIRALFLPFIKS